MPSKALFMLWIVLITLPNPLLAGKEEDEADAKRFIILYEQPFRKVMNIYLNETNDGGKEFIHPDDPNKVLMIYKFPSNDDVHDIISDQVTMQTLMAKSDELGNQIPITQKLFKMLRFPYGQEVGISLEKERFRNDLFNGLREDVALRNSLIDFTARLQMYKDLAYTFQQYVALDIKHCNIEVQKVLYKKAGDDFSTSPPAETDSAFTFVLSDFRYVKDLSTPCSRGMPSTWDHEDAFEEIPSSKKCKGKIEIFGLGMLILKIESIVLMISEYGLDNVVNRSQFVKNGLKNMTEAPPDISKFYNDKTPISNKTTFDIFLEIMEWSQSFNKSDKYYRDIDEVLTESSLLEDLAYIEQANTVFFEQRIITQHAPLEDNTTVRGKLMANYAAFNKLLQSMVKPNDYMNGRPDPASTIASLIKIQQAYVANIQSLARDRILLV